MTNLNNEYANAWGAVDSEETQGGQRQEDKLDYLATPEGDTRFRVLDAFPFFYKEWWSTKGNGGAGTSVPFKGAEDILDSENKAFMSKVFAEADAKGLKDKARKDFLRDHGYKKQPWGKVKEKYVIHVLDRATGEVKLLDKGNGVFKELKKYAMNPEYGDLRNYDVTLTRKGTGFMDTEYSITPARSNTPLTPAEIELYNAKKVDLAELKGGKGITAEQAYRVAQGATWKEVLGNGSDSPAEVAEKSDVGMLPDIEANMPTDMVKEEAPRKDEPVNVDQGNELSEEDLANIEF